jgi:uncharacterized protein (TIGR03067 family)
MRSLLAMALAAGVLVAADGPGDDAAKAEAKNLLGAWVVVSCETDGETVPERILRGEVVRFIIGADTITVKVEDQVKEEDRYTLDPRAKPAAIDLTDKAGRKALGIYALEGERLRICWTERGKARPTAFATRPGSGFDLFVLKRETK